jgi:hypothetical protein
MVLASDVVILIKVMQTRYRKRPRYDFSISSMNTAMPPSKWHLSFPKKEKHLPYVTYKKAWEHTVMKKMRDKRHRIPKML